MFYIPPSYALFTLSLNLWSVKIRHFLKFAQEATKQNPGSHHRNKTRSRYQFGFRQISWFATAATSWKSQIVYEGRVRGQVCMQSRIESKKVCVHYMVSGILIFLIAIGLSFSRKKLFFWYWEITVILAFSNLFGFLNGKKKSQWR